MLLRLSGRDGILRTMIQKVGCFPASKRNDDCWVEVPGRFISDNDVYMEFDDRWAHRGNTLNSSGQYEQTG